MNNNIQFLSNGLRGRRGNTGPNQTTGPAESDYGDHKGSVTRQQSSQTMPLHCRDVYTTSSSRSFTSLSSSSSLFNFSRVTPGEQSTTVFFTFEPSRAIARMSQMGVVVFIATQRAMK